MGPRVAATSGRLTRMAEQRTLTYRGNPALASALVRMLEEQGVAVQWERPSEARDLPDAAQDYVVAILANGTSAAIAIAVKLFRERFAQATVQTQGDDDD